MIVHIYPRLLDVVVTPAGSYPGFKGFAPVLMHNDVQGCIRVSEKTNLLGNW